MLVIDSTLLLSGVIVAEQVSQFRPQARRDQALAPWSHLALWRAACCLGDRHVHSEQNVTHFIQRAAHLTGKLGDGGGTSIR